MNPEEPIDYDKPAAYDPDGRPLYYHPAPQQPEQPAAVATPEPTPAPIVSESPAPSQTEPIIAPIFEMPPATSTPVEPTFQTTPKSDKTATTPPPKPIPESVRIRHDESMKLYPDLDLAPNEYVAIQVKRHPIGLIQIWLVTFVVFAAFLLFTIFFSSVGIFDNSAKPLIALVGLGMSVLTFFFGALATHIYQMNKFFVTNRRVINHIQRTLFSLRKQSIGLDGVEDVSYRQNGAMQTIFNYGSVRLATVGDETTYRFNFVKDPVSQIKTINQIIQDFDDRHGLRRRR